VILFSCRESWEIEIFWFYADINNLRRKLLVIEEKLGFIGVGNMGEALLRGIIGSKLISPSHIFISDINSQKLDDLSRELGVNAAEDNHDLIAKTDITLLAVKPNVIKAVLSEIAPDLNHPKWCISIAAGVNTTSIESILQSGSPVVRVMPNTPAMVYEGMTAICPGKNADERHVEKTQRIFQSVGKAIIVTEKLMDAVTALGGSGPAFIFLIIESLADAGVQLGLSREDALGIAAQMVIGASKMVLDTQTHPATLKNQVTSPGGTTAAGLYQLEKHGIRAAIIDAVVAAATRSKELSSD
jgi:pyrroline-5-carboxylate reductase